MAVAAKRVVVVAVLGFLALPVGSRTAEAVAGGGGRNVDVRMRGRTLVVRGAAGKIVGVGVVPARGGVRIVSGSSRINGREGPLFIRGRPRRVKGDFARSLWGDLVLSPPNEGVAPLRLRSVAVRGARTTTRVWLEGVKIDRHVRVRASAGRHAELTVVDSDVAGDARVRLGEGATTAFHVRRSAVEGGVAVVMKDGAAVEGTGGSVTVRESTVMSVDVQPRISAIIELSEIAEDVTVAGSPFVRVSDSVVRGALSINAVAGTNPPSAYVRVRDSSVLGATTIVADATPDIIELWGATFAALDVHAGAGDDLLSTTELSVTGAVSLDGGDGDADEWATDDENMLDVHSFETTTIIRPF